MTESSLAINKKKFDDHIQKKIDKLGERTRYINYKFEDVRYYFRKYSITIIYLATLLTLIEALMNSLPIEQIENIIARNTIRFIPLVISSSISLLAALIKFNKYEDKIENITRTTEKCITTMAKLKNIKEQLYFSTSNKKIVKLITIFLNTIYAEYLESNTNIENQLLDTDYAIYMKKVANNDIKRHEIMLYRSFNLKDQLNNTSNTSFIRNTNSTTNIRNIRQRKSILKHIRFKVSHSKFAKSYQAYNRYNPSLQNDYDEIIPSELNHKNNSVFANSSHAKRNISPQNDYGERIPSALTRENIRNSTNNVVIDIKPQENSEDEMSQDYSQFAPSSKGTDNKSFVGSIGSLLESETSKSIVSNKKNINAVNVMDTVNAVNAVTIIKYRWKKYIWKKNKSNKK